MEIQEGWGRILIADDDAVMREFVMELLRDEGYVCECVGSAGEATAALTAQRYDAFITDINMPDNTDLSYLEKLRDSGVIVPVIVMTGQPTVATAVEAVRHSSVVEYLLKPVFRETLCDSVMKAVGKGRVQRALMDIRERMELWVVAVTGLERRLAGAGKGGPEVVAQFIAEVGTLSGHVLQSLRVAVESVTRRPATAVDVCELLACPRRKLYDETLRDAVEVLRKTKDIVKLKELAGLRKQIESVLEANQ